jgi:uncharacterized protein (TIGR04255 family)
VQFDPLPKLTNAHLGAFWTGLGANWLQVSDAPPLEPQFEKFGDSGSWSRVGVRLTLAQVAPTRVQIRNADGDRMIQIQNGRLHFNWLGQGCTAYPRYEAVRKDFDETLAQFKEFLAREGLGELRPNQWEVTYVNQFPKNTVWKSPDDWRFFRPLQSIQGLNQSVQLESFGGEWHFEISPQRGRLHVKWQHGCQSDPMEQELIVLTLTARGPLPATAEAKGTLGEGLDLGHATIVRTFRDLMTDEANSYWGLTHGND